MQLKYKHVWEFNCCILSRPFFVMAMVKTLQSTVTHQTQLLQGMCSLWYPLMLGQCSRNGPDAEWQVVYKLINKTVYIIEHVKLLL